MRLLLAVAAGLALTLATLGRAAAEPCKGGPVIYRVTVTSLSKGAPVDNLGGIIKKQVFEVRSSGAWQRSDDSDDGKVTASGCLGSADLPLFKDAVRRATLRVNNSAGHGACIVKPSRRVVTELPARKKRKETQQPCGVTLDAHTERLFSCLWVAMDPAQAPDHVTDVCRDG